MDISRYLPLHHAYLFAIVGGILWIIHGLFVLYNIAGIVALMMSSFALLGLAQSFTIPSPQLSSSTRQLSCGAFLLGAIALIGVSHSQ